jgi:cell division protease FtsH
MARAMVAELGMSDRIGPVAAAVHAPSPFLQTTGQPAALAEETAREIDLEVKRLMTDASATAVDILSRRRSALAEISRRLLEHEVVDGDEVRRIVAAAPEKNLNAA